MGEKVALGSLATGITLFGFTLAEVGQMATIFAGVCGGVASLGAFVYYIVNIFRKK